MGRFTTGARIVSVAVVSTLLLAGCTPGLQDNGVAGGADLRLYTGPIPAPATMPKLDVPPMPQFAADASDAAAMEEHTAAVDEYIASTSDERLAYIDDYKAFINTTRMGGEQSLAAWQTLLVKAGVVVIGADGEFVEVDGTTGFGWPTTDAELRLHAVLATSSGGIRLVDLADALAGVPELEGVDVATALYDDLSRARDAGFAEVLWNLNHETFYRENSVRPIEEVMLTWGQVGVVLRRLSAELATHGAARSGSGAASHGASAAEGFAVFPASYSTSVVASGSKKACDLNIDNPWAAELLNQFNKAHTLVFDKTISHIDDFYQKTNGQKGGTLGAKIGIARLISAFATVIAKATALRATFTVADIPLVRTKDTQPGELRDLTIKYEFDKDSWEEIRGCMNLFLSPLGLDYQGSASGNASGIGVDLASEDPGVLRIGDGKGGSTPVTEGKTDANGETTFILSGAPQLDILPHQAEAEDVEVTLRAVSNLGSNDFFKDMASLPWDALDAASTGGLSTVPQLLSRMKLITHTAMAPVRDWSLDAEFEVTLIGSFEARSAYHSEQISACSGGLVTHTSSSETSASLASDPVRVSALLLSNPDGNLGDTAAVFVPAGEEFQLLPASGDVWMFTMPVNYTTTQNYNSPAVGEVPPPERKGSGGCADGGTGETYVPPPLDCGQRSYSSLAEVVIRAPRTLNAADAGNGVMGQLWENCAGGSVVAPGGASLGCPSPEFSGGNMPSVGDLFDSSKKILEVDGALNCNELRTGTMSSMDYQWTLVFCRVDDNGEAAC